MNSQTKSTFDSGSIQEKGTMMPEQGNGRQLSLFDLDSDDLSWTEKLNDITYVTEDDDS